MPDKIKTNIGAIDTYPKLVLALIALELVLGVILYTIGHFRDNAYMRGAGVGLAIAWVTSVIAYWKAGGTFAEVELILFEFVLSIIFLAISLFLKENQESK